MKVSCGSNLLSLKTNVTLGKLIDEKSRRLDSLDIEVPIQNALAVFPLTQAFIPVLVYWGCLLVNSICSNVVHRKIQLSRASGGVCLLRWRADSPQLLMADLLFPLNHFN
jgi:hypothetical protein